MSARSRREFLKKVGTISLIGAASPMAAYSAVPLGTGGRDAKGFEVNLIPFGLVNAYFTPYKLYWGDIHAHTGFSDGYGSAHEFYKRARYCQGLDFAAMADHGEWMRNLDKAFNSGADKAPDIWNQYCRASRRHNHPSKFVTLVGVEWSGRGGHRCVYFKGFDNLPPFPPVNQKTYPTPVDLWKFLESCPVESFTVPHHSTQPGLLTHWEYHHESERLVEIYSEWGNSEDYRSMVEPLLPYRQDPQLREKYKAHFVNSVIHSGVKIGIIAGTDNHQGLAGSCTNDAARGISLAEALGFQKLLNQNEFFAFAEALKKKRVDTLGKYLHLMQNGYTMDHRTDNTTEKFRSGGGLCAVYAGSLTNRSVWNGLWDRRTYGTTGPRPRVKFCVRSRNQPNRFALMGDEMTSRENPELLLSVRTVELGLQIREIQIVKNGNPVLTLPYDDETDMREIALSVVDTSPPQNPVDAYYVRMQLEEAVNHDADGLDKDQLREHVWTSPVWVNRKT